MRCYAACIKIKNKVAKNSKYLIVSLLYDTDLRGDRIENNDERKGKLYGKRLKKEFINVFDRGWDSHRNFTDGFSGQDTYKNKFKKKSK